MHQKEGGGSPSDMLLTDRPLLVCVALWALSVAVIIYGHRGPSDFLMAKSKVAILKHVARHGAADYHALMNLAGYQDVIAKDADTALKVNISWHFFFPGSSTTPWQLDGVIRAMKQDGYDPA